MQGSTIFALAIDITIEQKLMRGLCAVLVLWISTVGGLAASIGAPNLNDTLTGGEGAQSWLAKRAPFTIVIDAGHGGRDAGCSGAHSKEKHLALGLSLALGELLETQLRDVEVIYTRDRDVFVPLHERARVANDAQADLFVSIHCNYLVGSSRVHGSETYVMGLHTADHNLQVAKRENAAMKLEQDVSNNYAFDPESPEGHIILSMFQHAFLEQSIAAAQAIEHQMAQRNGRRSRGVRQAGFMVLKETAMPSVLVESGYLSNADEEDYLLNEQGQARTAEAMFRGLRQYIREARGSDRAVTASQQTSAAKPGIVTDVDSSEQPATDPTVELPPIHYYVQLAASSNQVDTRTRRWQALPAPVRYLREAGFYKYQAGPVANEQAANSLLAAARDQGFADAWIVAYRDDERIAIPEQGNPE